MKEILDTLLTIADKNMIPTPYIIGGVTRDLYLKINEKERDIDITTNSSDIARLAILYAWNQKRFFEVFDDGHISVYLKKYKIDFSTNFISEEVLKYLRSTDKDDPALYEPYSRDFTVNILHYNIRTNKFEDPLNQSLRDLDAKILKTPVPAEITLKDDPNRIFRAINLSARFGFSIDDEIIDFVLNNKQFIINSAVKKTFIEKYIGEAIAKDSQKTIENLLKMNILDLIPLSGKFKEELIKRKLVKQYLDMLW